MFAIFGVLLKHPTQQSNITTGEKRIKRDIMEAPLEESKPQSGMACSGILDLRIQSG
jgi:hypothetical protein